jgi:hypothetical protein
MKNAHLRFGRLEFIRQMRDTTTEVRLAMDRFIGEEGSKGGAGRAHLVSVVGGDQDVGAVWSGVVENDVLTVSGPDLEPMPVSFGEGAQCFRGSLNVGGRKRPVRHLVAISAEIAARVAQDATSIRTILCDSDASFVLYRVARRMGLPAMPEWAGWFLEELQRRKAVAPLIGLGCTPVAVTASKKALLKWIGRAVKRGELPFSQYNGPITWKVPNNFLSPELAEGGDPLAQDVEVVGASAPQRPVSDSTGRNTHEDDRERVKPQRKR